MPEKTPARYAIVDYAGKQFRVTAGQELKVPLTDGEAGGSMQLERVLLLNDGSTTHFGDPTVAGASVDATLLRHGRDKKIIVFKFRRRKGYRKKAGHRQGYSILRINGINRARAKQAAEAKADKEPAKVEAREGIGKATPKKPTSAKKTAASSKSTAAPRKSAATEKKTTLPRKSTATKKPATTGKSASAKKSTPSKKSSATSKSTGRAIGTTSKSGTKKKAGA